MMQLLQYPCYVYVVDLWGEAEILFIIVCDNVLLYYSTKKVTRKLQIV